MKKILSSILSAVMACAMLCTPVMASETTTPSGVEFSKIGTEIENFVAENEGNYASVATAVFHGDEVVYSNHFGYVDRENQVKADENSVYEWGSISKLLVWVSAMQLHEQGKLDLNADIQTYLPEGFLTKLKYDEPITMLNLMNHNAGWQEVAIGIEASSEDKIIPLGDILKKTEPAQVFKPGEITAYSNWGAALAGYIVECVSGMDYAQYVHENILAPLGMEHTSVSANLRDNEWVRAQREKQKAYMIMTEEMAGTRVDKDLGQCIMWIIPYPAGSVTGTLADITKFGQALVSDDCMLFEKQETLELFRSASDFYGDSDIPKCCHGMWLNEYAVRTMGHGGNTNGGSANLMFDPVSKTGVVVLTNQGYEMIFTSDIFPIVFGSIKDNPTFKNTQITERTDLSGNYVASRSIFNGALKMMNALSYLPLSEGETPDSYTQGGMTALTRISDNLYMIEGSDQFLYESKKSDGTIILEGASVDYIASTTVVTEFAMVIVFVIITVVTLVLLIIKGIRKLAKKYKPIPAGKAILAGQLAKLTVALVIVVVLTLLMSLNATVIAMLCILMAICAVVCVVSAVFTAKALVTEKEMKAKSRIMYVVYTLCNLYATVFVIYFELFNFWA